MEVGIKTRMASRALRQAQSCMPTSMEEMERYALEYPEYRKEIVAAITAYGGREKNWKKAREAMGIVERINAASMLEGLRDEEDAEQKY